MNIRISVKKEKAIVFAGAIITYVAGVLTTMGKYTEAGAVATIGGLVLTFWSEGVNTEA
jgi:uncharacterized membrane protein (DUF4010 family)